MPSIRNESGEDARASPPLRSLAVELGRGLAPGRPAEVQLLRVGEGAERRTAHATDDRTGAGVAAEAADDRARARADQAARESPVTLIIATGTQAQSREGQYNWQGNALHDLSPIQGRD